MTRGAFLRVVVMLASALGVVALWLPFIDQISPLDAIAMSPGLEGDELLLFSIATPALLAVPIALWNLARLVSPVPTAAERRGAYTLSTAAMALVLPISALTLAGGELLEPLPVTALAAAWLAVLANVGLSVRNRASGIAAGIAAETYLLLGYLPGALYALILFSYAPFFSSEPYWLWRSGAYAVLATCALYVTQAVLRLRRAAARNRRPAARPR
jgi:hypothetical protein